MQITIRFGLDHVTKTFTTAPTIGQLKANDDIRSALGYGDNVKALVNGVEMGDDVSVGSGQTVVVETAANHKAS